MIFEHSRSSSFLRHYLRVLPKKGFGEARKMANHLGVSSTYMSQVLSSAKVLTLEQAFELGEYLGLSALESEYFLLMIQSERAGTARLKAHFAQKLQELKQKSLKLVNRVDAKRSLTDQEKSIFYSNALYSAIHIYCATEKKGRSIEELAQRFDIPRTRVTEITRFLSGTGLCIETNGRFMTGTQSTHLEQGSPHLLKHYTNWRLRALKAAEALHEQELMYTINVALSVDDFIALREEMVQFIKTFLAKALPSPSEEVACLNMDWFWIRK
jgi:plasmid maintenance system antidote protein VapI